MTTVYEVANLAGVSTATVSRVIHGSNLVHRDTRERVLAVIEELGYVPDGSAQSLSRRRKDIIGLAGLERGVTEVGIEKTGPLFMDELVHAVEAVLRGTECSLLLTFGRAGEQFQRRVRALSGKVDGLLIAEEVLPPAPLRALARRIPVVAIAGRPEETELDVVAVDNAAGMAGLAAHLIEEHGYRRPGRCWPGGPRPTSSRAPTTRWRSACSSPCSRPACASRATWR
jgi:LacI family transcriptional regulator